MNTIVKEFFDKDTFTLTYLVYDKVTLDSIIIDPVLNFDNASGKLSHESVDELVDFINENSLKPQVILETHAHADHLTGAKVLLKHFPNLKIGIGKHINLVQKVFESVFNLKNQDIEGKKFDILLDEETDFEVGTLKVKTIFTPGHTPACSSYLIDGHLFVGDTLFMPDYGTGRCDFPGGCSKELYHSISNKLYKLPDSTNVYTGHDYLPNGRDLMFKTTIAESKKSNIQLNQDTKEDEFVNFRNNRDKTLSAPKLLLPSLQVNINAGDLPLAEENGTRYLKLPLKE